MLLYETFGLAAANWRPDARRLKLYYAANISASVALAVAARLWLALGLTAATLRAVSPRESSRRGKLE
jgi:hypothetical protein